MNHERITLAELDRRMAMFEPYIPRTEVMGGLQALNDALDEVALWRRIGLGSLVIMLVSVVVASLIVAIGSSQEAELLVYQKRCVTPEATDALLKTSEAITYANVMCIDQHKKDREFLQAMFAKADELYKAADKAGVVYAIGGDAYEDVSVLPDAKATDFFLHGEEPGRRSGVVVQAVQQHPPEASP